MHASLDDVSGGRFRFALGAGWYEREFQAYSVPWHNHDSRIERSREQIEIIKSLWVNSVTNFSGFLYNIRNGVLEPKPVQKPHPPIWWGGESEKSRELVADLADGWLMSSSSLIEAEEKINDMRGRLKAKGRSDIQYALPGRIYIGETDEDAENHVKELTKGNDVLQSSVLSRGFVGSSETIAERINHLSELGFNYIILQISPARQTLEKIIEEILPIL